MVLFASAETTCDMLSTHSGFVEVAFSRKPLKSHESLAAAGVPLGIPIVLSAISPTG